jgi:hypothetical protein
VSDLRQAHAALAAAGSLLPLCRYSAYIASKQQKQSARQAQGALNLISVSSVNKIMLHGQGGENIGPVFQGKKQRT